jgi:hypothetical protein
MKVATASVAGEPRVGQIAKDETSIAPFDFENEIVERTP